MTQDKYIYFINKTHTDFSDLINKTQQKLDVSKDKIQDYNVLCRFWNVFSSKAIRKWDDSSTLFLDSDAIMPMVESVSKQFVNMLFNIKHLDVLTDLGIYEGFE